MFGKGLYFADMSSKSANYCYTTPAKNTGLVLLSEVSDFRLPVISFKIWFIRSHLANGMNYCMQIAMLINYRQVYRVLKHLVQLHLIPKMKSNCKFFSSAKVHRMTDSFSLMDNRDGDITVPMGPGESTKANNSKGYTLNYNEYIVYDTKQVRLRYLIRLKFLYN